MGEFLRCVKIIGISALAWVALAVVLRWLGRYHFPWWDD